jgi:hypothetical protein
MPKRPCQGAPAERGNWSGVIIGDDLSSKGGRFLIVENGYKIDVHVGVPLSHVTLHRNKVIGFENRRRQCVLPDRPSGR